MAEYNLQLLWSLTIMRERRAVMSISERRRAMMLKKLRILTATDNGTKTTAFVRGHGHGEVEAVDEADGVGNEVAVAAVVECELGEGSGGGAGEAGAFEAVAAVASGAGEMGACVGAASATPDAAGPVVSWGGEGAVGEGGEAEAAVFEDVVAGVGGDGWTDGEGTVVDDG
ncbi:hypothetical protein KFK09_006620 [Dendrobium nobile]|uniref:Uncharacterized protein n=1 Tax=Dendrobium nobile TaxID=94219 RepID=A0A8T3BQ27_DENNO|nr:hypothetical protein KFK09_006620 [Dendrobium nobile]